MFKSWIKDVSESVVNGTEISGVPADQRLVGTDAHRKYVETMVPGSSYGKQFINKYRKRKLTQKMGNIISEDAEKQHRLEQVLQIKFVNQQDKLAYDVRYKVKQGFKDGQKQIL